MIDVISAALGGKKQASAPVDDGARDVTAGAQTLEQAVAAMNAMFSIG